MTAGFRVCREHLFILIPSKRPALSIHENTKSFQQFSGVAVRTAFLLLGNLQSENVNAALTSVTLIAKGTVR
ncbi:hypothetical protein BN77_p11557 [Rhizobium mesoamericanum STM3625]|uniref:Uncharacterized protein n=1 Tax=Rhizobium mesoamericanum STM3625 TaxID=1211777 RepID=K0Q3E3_9HYPH|nr:hypothetical protein BN77_p11557 [Rhizobium mesoamericanum STM3625]